MSVPARAAAARTRVAALVRGEGAHPWSDADVIRLDTLMALGPPAEVVALGAAKVSEDNGEAAWGTLGTRSDGGAEAEARSSALHTWRGVGALCGCPLPSPHEIKRSER